MEDAIVTVIVFAGIYQIIKVFTDFLLKRRIISAGHVDKAGILDLPKDKEDSSYATLKWGLVALFAGVGLLIIALFEASNLFPFHSAFWCTLLLPGSEILQTDNSGNI